MKNQEKRNRFVLTLIFSAVVFITLFTTMIIVAVFFLLLIKFGLFSVNTNEPYVNNIVILIAITSIILGTDLSFFYKQNSSEACQQVNKCNEQTFTR